MKLAADFRQAAREALRGKWPIAILIGLVAVLLGGAGSGGPEVKFNYDVSSGVSTTFGYGGQTIYSTGYGLDPKWSGLLIGGAVYLIVIALVLAAAYFILGSIVGVGYAKYNLGLVDRTELGFEALFAYLPNWKTTTLTRRYSPSCLGVSAVSSVPPTVMDPASAASSPPTRLRNVDLPLPEGPSSTQISPAPTAQLTSCSTLTRASPSP